jgi:hypothetical protein
MIQPDADNLQNRSFLELDYLFHERVPARAFRTYPINSRSSISYLVQRLMKQCPSSLKPMKQPSTETLTTKRRMFPRLKSLSFPRAWTLLDIDHLLKLGLWEPRPFKFRLVSTSASMYIDIFVFDNEPKCIVSASDLLLPYRCF